MALLHHFPLVCFLDGVVRELELQLELMLPFVFPLVKLIISNVPGDQPIFWVITKRGNTFQWGYLVRRPLRRDYPYFEETASNFLVCPEQKVRIILPKETDGQFPTRPISKK